MNYYRLTSHLCDFLELRVHVRHGQRRRLKHHSLIGATPFGNDTQVACFLGVEFYLCQSSSSALSYRFHKRRFGNAQLQTW